MAERGGTEIRRLLGRLDRGDRASLDELFPYIYDELSEVAHRLRQRWHRDYTLNTTALIHEGYLKLVGQRRIRAESRAHLLALAGKAMRHILLNYARDRRVQRRGGNACMVPLDESRTPAEPMTLSARQTSELLTLHEVLRSLEQVNARQCRVVEYRFFAGMTVDETASAIGVSARTVKRDWASAKAYLNIIFRTPAGDSESGRDHGLRSLLRTCRSCSLAGSSPRDGYHSRMNFLTLVDWRSLTDGGAEQCTLWRRREIAGTCGCRWRILAEGVAPR